MPDWLLAKRTLTDEWMDDLSLPPDQHAHALAGLARINRASHASRAMRQVILRHLRTHASPRPLHLLDVACGSADVPLSVAGQLRRRGFDIRLTLCDRSPTALDLARCHACRAGFPDADILPLDATISSLPYADVVTCSLFLHHLTRAQTLATLTALRAAATELLVVNDLRRSLTGYLAAWVGCYLLTRSPVVRYDGPISARAAWSISELRQLAQEAGISAPLVTRAPGWRMRLIWSKP